MDELQNNASRRLTSGFQILRALFEHAGAAGAAPVDAERVARENGLDVGSVGFHVLFYEQLGYLRCAEHGETMAVVFTDAGVAALAAAANESGTARGAAAGGAGSPGRHRRLRHLRRWRFRRAG